MNNWKEEFLANYRAEIVHFWEMSVFLLVPSVEDRNCTPFAKFSPSEEYMRAIGQAAQSREVVCSQIYKNGGSSYVTVFAPIVYEKEAVEAALCHPSGHSPLANGGKKAKRHIVFSFSLLMAGLYFFYKHETKKVLRFGVQKTKELEQLQMAEKSTPSPNCRFRCPRDTKSIDSGQRVFANIFVEKKN